MKCWMLGWLCEGVIFFSGGRQKGRRRSWRCTVGCYLVLILCSNLLCLTIIAAFISMRPGSWQLEHGNINRPSWASRAPGAWQLAWQVEHGNFNPPSSASQHLPLWPMWKFVPHMVDAYRACSTYPQGPLRGQEPGETSGPGCQHLGRTPVSGSSASGSWTNFFGHEGLHHQLASIRDGAPAEAICD